MPTIKIGQCYSNLKDNRQFSCSKEVNDVVYRTRKVSLYVVNYSPISLGNTG
jgi:hypothetical protein